jgi:hypothetical protein
MATVHLVLSAILSKDSFRYLLTPQLREFVDALLALRVTIHWGQSNGNSGSFVQPSDRVRWRRDDLLKCRGSYCSRRSNWT